MRKVELIFHDGSKNPPVKAGHCQFFIVSVQRGDSKRIVTFPATYLNQLKLEHEWPEETCKTDGCDHEEGCPETGWRADVSEDEYAHCYTELLGPRDILLEWAAIPQRPEAGK